MLKQVMEAHELLDDAQVHGQKVADLLKSRGLGGIDVQTISGERGSTDFIKTVIPGTEGKKSGGNAPTLGIIGRLGGIAARPERIGMVSDADGALTAVSCALKLADMRKGGDILKGDVIIATHVCPNAPTEPREQTTGVTPRFKSSAIFSGMSGRQPEWPFERTFIREVHAARTTSSGRGSP